VFLCDKNEVLFYETDTQNRYKKIASIVFLAAHQLPLGKALFHRGDCIKTVIGKNHWF
jgi:hypothetical protein